MTLRKKIVFIIIGAALIPALSGIMAIRFMKGKIYDPGNHDTLLQTGLDQALRHLEMQRNLFNEATRVFCESTVAKRMVIELATQRLTQEEISDFWKQGYFNQNSISFAGIYFNGLVSSRGRWEFNDTSILRSFTEKERSELFLSEGAIVNSRRFVISESRILTLVFVRKIDPSNYDLFQSAIKKHEELKLHDQSLDSYVQFLFVLLTVSCIVCIGILFVSIHRLLLSHLLTLANDAKNISEGIWNAPIQVHTEAIEIMMIAKAFNRLIENAKAERDQILKLEKVVTWREIAQRLAHEIKNPLTPIQLTIQQIKDSYRGDDAQFKRILDECCEIIEEEIESLRNLTKEFSEFARMPQIKLRTCDLNPIVQDTIILYPDLVQLTLHSGLSSVNADPESIKRVLQNLLDNSMAALKDRIDGLIRVATSEDTAHIRLTISDNGAGIPATHLSKIFEPHFSTKSTGMGLGLSIVKQIIDEHGATITVESIENLGTTFIIKFLKIEED